MSFTTLLKNECFKSIIESHQSLFHYLCSLYKQFKFKRKIKKMKRKLIRNGVKYDKKTLFNDSNSSVLFIHIPKAAGMSVVKTLYNLDKSHHASASDYLHEDKNKFCNAFSFAITRNPYTRLYSAYNYLKNGGMNNIDLAWKELYLAKYDNFNDFIVGGGLEFAIEKNAEHFIPQHKFIFDEDDKLQCDYLGKIESISETEALLTEKLQRKILFTPTNVISHCEPILKDIYSDEMLAIVNKCYQKDFLLLAYSLYQIGY